MTDDRKQDARMPAITIRDLPVEVRDEFGGATARSGRSLQEYLARHLIQLGSRPWVR